MKQIDGAVSAVKKFVAKEGRFVCTVSVMLILFFVIALVVMIVQCVNKPGPKAQPFDVEFVPDASFMQPAYGSSNEDYYFSRLGRTKWDEDEVKRWFTMPDDSSIEDLSRANDSLVDEITGAAP